jgi:MoaA/NifB/PqqE/SkfB family radical SAM enzyme
MPDASVIPCCVSPYDDIYGNGSKENLKSIWNSPKFKELRLKMLNGQMHEGCARCYTLEATGLTSMRQEMNLFFSKYMSLVKETNSDGFLSSFNLKYIDIRFSNLCNFKCRGCGPTLSSAWYDDHQKLFNFHSNEEKVKSIDKISPEFWNELKSFLPQADVIYFGGGEPLISKEHYEVLSLLTSHSLFEINLRYNTNLSILNYQGYDLVKLWSKFKSVSMSISIDDFGTRAEYFRHGTVWENIEKNILRLIYDHPTIELAINCTVNIFNVFYLPEIYEYFIDKKYIQPNRFIINLLLDPIELRCDVFPPSSKKIICNKLRRFIFKLNCRGNEFRYMINEILSVIKFINENDRSDLLPLFFKHTSTLDHLRKEKFNQTYPELAKLLPEFS